MLNMHLPAVNASSFPTLFDSTYIYKHLELGTVLHTRDTKMNEMLSQLLRCSESYGGQKDKQITVIQRSR